MTCLQIIIKPAGKIKWEYFEWLLKIQEELGLKLTNKLSKSHVHFLKNTMKVKYAVQILSLSIADAMEVLNLLKIKDLKGCEVMVEFILKLDRMVNFLNSRNPQGK